LGSGWAANLLFPTIWLIVPCAIIFYGLLLFITRVVRLTDKTKLKLVLT